METQNISKRTLDTILEAAQGITGKLTHGIKTLFFPVENLEIRYDSNKKEEYLAPRWKYDVSQPGFERLSDLSKAFRNRRTVNIGEKYTAYLRWYSCHGGGSRLEDYDTKRIDKNTIVLDKYIVSTDDKQLLEYAKKGLTPIKYNWLIF